MMRASWSPLVGVAGLLPLMEGCRSSRLCFSASVSSIRISAGVRAPGEEKVGREGGLRCTRKLSAECLLPLGLQELRLGGDSASGGVM